MMTCAQWREAASARLDGEDPGASTAALDDHVAHCSGCRGFAPRIGVLDELLTSPSADAPDLSSAILASVRVSDANNAGVARPRTATRHPIRVALGLVGLVQLATALPSVFLLTGAHTSRDLAAFQLALAVGFLVAAARPATAAGLLPTAGALVAVLAFVVVGDIAGGRVAAGAETIHATEIAGVALLWLLAPSRTATGRLLPG